MKKAAVLVSLICLVGLTTMARRRVASFPLPEELKYWSPLGRLPVFIEDNVASFACYGVPGKELTFGFQEHNPASGEWERTVFEYSTPYDVTHVVSREGGRDLLLLGVLETPEGWKDIIEKWAFPKVRGSYVAEVSPAPTPRGTPRGPYDATVTIKGGAYIAHGDRLHPKVQGSGGTPNHNWRPEPSKTTIYLGQGNLFDCGAVDPEGRFLLVHSYNTGNLYSIDLLTQSAPLVLEFSVAQIPDLAFVRGISIFDHPTQGRFCRLSQTAKNGTPGPTGKTIVLVDAQNDGSFESFQVYAPAALAQSPWNVSADWHDPVNYGWDWQADFDSH